MKQNVKKLLAVFLALAICLESLGNVLAAEITDRERDNLASDVGNLDMSGNDSVGRLLAKTLSGEQDRQEALAETGDYITELEISGNNATVDFCTTTDAEIIVAIYEEKTGCMLGSGKAVVGMQDFSVDVLIDTDSGTMPQYFIATAYLLDVETHHPLCKELTVDLYTESIQKLLSSTVNDYPDNLVVNLDESLSTNFAVGNKDMLVLDEESERYQIVDNGDGTYTVKNPDNKILDLQAGDTFSYEYDDGSILLVKVSDIMVNGNTVIITEEKDVDLTDFFDYIKIEADSYGCEMKLEEVPGSNIDAKIETGSLDVYNQYKIRAWEDEGSLSQSFSVPISKKLDEITFKGAVSFGFTAKVKYYLSLSYQHISLKLEYSAGVSLDISGKSEMLEMPLMRVEVPILPCVNLGFTPSFVVQASAKIAWSGEIKGTLGVEYDSNSGMKNLCQAPSTSSKLEISGTLFVGIKATPYVGIINSDLAKVKLDMTAGIEAVAKHRVYSSSSSDRHECELCFDGTLSTKLSATAGMDLIKDLVKLELKVAEIKLKISDFYYSDDYGEFGWSTCPHIKYKTTINTLDTNGNVVPEAKLVIKDKYTNENVVVETPDGKNGDAVTDDSGKIDVYLGNGSYTIEAATDDMSGAKTFTVHDKKTSGKIILKENFNTDITTDPDKCLVQIKAVDESGVPVEGAVVSCSKLEKTYMTDEKGIVLLKLPTDVYDLFFKTDKLSGYIRIAVENNEINENLVMKADATGIVQLTVIDNSGNPVPDAKIGGTGFSVIPHTDENGKAILELKVGKQYLLIIEKGELSGNCKVTVQEGEQDIQVKMETGIFDWMSWTLTDGVLTIYGKGDMPNYNLDNRPEWYGLQITKVIVKDGITSIGFHAFSNCYDLVNVEIPNSVTSIDAYAFDHCRSLTNIKIPNSVTSIGGGTFYGCSNLESLKLPEGLTSINDHLFYMCSNLKNIELPSNVTTIMNEAFQGCTSLGNINIPEEVSTIGSQAFMGCSSLKNIELPLGMNSIANRTFEGCNNLENIKLSSGIISIGQSAFQSCKSLKEIKLPVGVTSVGQYAFSNCSSLISIELPSQITKIEDYTFAACSSLKEILFSSDIESIGESAFRECSSLLSIKLPLQLTAIEENTFYGCSSLTSIEIPLSVTSIGQSAFANCKNLISIELPSGVDTIQYNTFSNCSSLKEIKFSPNATIGKSAFNGCSSLENIELPLQMTSIEENTFNRCSSLSNIELPHQLISIGNGAFGGCSNLSSIEFPASLNSIGNGSFSSCTNLTRVEFPDSLTSLGYAAFSGCRNLSKIYFKGDKPSSFATNAFTGGLKTAYYPQNNNTWIGIDDYLDWDGGYVNKVTWEAYDPASLSAEISEKKVDIKDRNIVIKSNNDIIKETQMFYASSINSQKSAFDYTGLMPEALYIFAIVKDEKADNIFDAKNLQYIEQGITSNIGQIQFSFNDEIVNGTSVIYGPSNKNLANAEVTVGKITADGTVQYPDVSVIYNGIELEENIDFKLSGDTRITDAGTYLLTVKGINNYAGSKTVSYTTSNIDIKPEINISVRIAGATNLKNGSTVQLIAEISPDNTKIKSLSWSSDNPSVATVDQNGLVTAKGAGKAKITVTCTSEDGKIVSASCVISVEKSSEDSDDISSDVNNPEKPDDTANNGSGDGLSGNDSNNGNSGSSGSSSSSGSNSSSGNLPSDDNVSDDNLSGDNDDQLIAKLAYYIVQFDANLGIKLSRKTMTLLNDDNLGILPKVQRKKYIFNGWFTQKIGGTKVNSSTVLNAGTTLFAHWTKAKPSKVKVLLLKSKKAGQIAVNFQKIVGAKGYEISYSTNKKFSSSTTKKTISVAISDKLKKLKSGKKYYVRVRAYNLDSTGKKVYGSYSAVKSIKVK